MNFITKFFHELFNPHCEHCSDERIDASFCSSCETLKMQLSVYQQQNEKLLDKLLTPAVESFPTSPVTSDIKPIQTRQIPWNVRKQMLESESREKVAALRNAAKPDSKIEELETAVLGNLN